MGINKEIWEPHKFNLGDKKFTIDYIYTILPLTVGILS